MISPDGGQEKTMLGEANLNEALALADIDINENWEMYKARYLRRLGR